MVVLQAPEATHTRTLPPRITLEPALRKSSRRPDLRADHAKQAQTAQGTGMAGLLFVPWPAQNGVGRCPIILQGGQLGGRGGRRLSRFGVRQMVEDFVGRLAVTPGRQALPQAGVAIQIRSRAWAGTRSGRAAAPPPRH